MYVFTGEGCRQCYCHPDLFGAKQNFCLFYLSAFASKESEWLFPDLVCHIYPTKYHAITYPMLDVLPAVLQKFETQSRAIYVRYG